MNEAKKLSASLNGYLNIYKNHMMTAIRALDFFNNIISGKHCNEQGCKRNDKKINWIVWLILVIYGIMVIQKHPHSNVLVAVILSVFLIIIQATIRGLQKTSSK